MAQTSTVGREAPEKPAQSHSRIAELDGFRTAAVLLVLVCHLFYGATLPPAAYSWMPRLLREIVSHGWLGVDLFFLLSGFLITGILLDTRETPHYFRDFYARRTLRIMPLYLATIVVYWFAYPGNGAYFGLSLLFLANFNHYFGVAQPHGPGVYWSLGVEEHFYLLWPILVRSLSRSHLLAVSVAIVIGSPVLRGVCTWWGMDPEWEIYPYSFFRFDGLAFGAVLAIWARSSWYSRRSARMLAAGLVALALVITIAGWPFGVLQTKTVASSALRYTQAQLCFASLIVLALAYRGTTYTSILRLRPVRVIADLSYCIYLVHLALLDLYYVVLKAAHIDDVTSFGPAGALAVRTAVVALVSVGVAALSKRFLEDPFLRLKRHFTPGSARSAQVQEPSRETVQQLG